MRALLERIGFRVFYGADLGRDDMDRLTIAFSRAARRAQVAFAFYAGHGVQVDGTNYLIPVDALIEDEADLRQMFRLDDMIRDAARRRALGVVAVDACRDNPFAGEHGGTTDCRSDAVRSWASTRQRLRRAAGSAAPHAGRLRDVRQRAPPRTDSAATAPSPRRMLQETSTEPRDVRIVFGEVVDDVVSATHNQQRPNNWDSLGGSRCSLVRPEVGGAGPGEPSSCPLSGAAIQRSLVRLGLLASAEGGDAFGDAPCARAISSFQRRPRRSRDRVPDRADEMVALHSEARSRRAPSRCRSSISDDVPERAWETQPDRTAMLAHGQGRTILLSSRQTACRRACRYAVCWYRKAADAGDVTRR